MPSAPLTGLYNEDMPEDESKPKGVPERHYFNLQNWAKMTEEERRLVIARILEVMHSSAGKPPPAEKPDQPKEQPPQ